ncbi:MAG TPA: hypothetical protein PK976_06250, partial [Bacteroidales bacterium]|nr:hypothetical protein [Bacteroidales bacterium]
NAQHGYGSSLEITFLPKLPVKGLRFNIHKPAIKFMLICDSEILIFAMEILSVNYSPDSV